MSKSIQNDLIPCISGFLINQIKNEIRLCKTGNVNFIPLKLMILQILVKKHNVQ
jgi:hypothetical protein